MKFFSLSSIAHGAVAAAKRFPLAILCGVTVTITAILMIQFDEPSPHAPVVQIFFTALLGIPFFIGLRLLGERTGGSSAAKAGLQALGVLLLFGYWWTLPPNPLEAPEYHMIRFALLFLSAHFFVAVAPYLRTGELNGFWHYNETLFLRVLVTGLYAFVLFIGLTVALAAVKHLFELDIPGKRYGQLFALIGGTFTPFFFLSMVPEDFPALQSDERYPKPLKIFTQFVLLPLVTVYLVILYAYMIKIAAQWSWPQGWVANLVLGFSVAGMFSLLLLHPIRSNAENVWIRTYARWFYVALVPLVVLLLLSIGRRVGEYGLTENRYFVIVLGCWLTAMVLLAIFRKGPGIRLIPVSLGVLAFLSAVGPWSASSVSLRDQMGRFERVLASNGMLVDGKAHRAKQPLSFDDAKTLSGAMWYIFVNHGQQPLQKYFDTDLYTLAGDSTSTEEHQSRSPRVGNVCAYLGVEFVDQWQVRDNLTHNFRVKSHPAADIAGFDLMMSIGGNSAQKGDTVATSGGSYHFWFSRERPAMLMEDPSGKTFTVPVDTLVARLERSVGPNMFWDVPGERMRFEWQGEGIRLLGLADQVWVEKRADTLRVTQIRGRILVGKLPG
jgi:hypothetical protein